MPTTGTQSTHENEINSGKALDSNPTCSLPFCRPAELIESKTEGLGEALLGYELIKSNIEMKFKSRTSLDSFFLPTQH